MNSNTFSPKFWLDIVDRPSPESRPMMTNCRLTFNRRKPAFNLGMGIPAKICIWVLSGLQLDVYATPTCHISDRQNTRHHLFATGHGELSDCNLALTCVTADEYSLASTCIPCMFERQLVRCNSIFRGLLMGMYCRSFSPAWRATLYLILIDKVRMSNIIDNYSIRMIEI